MATFPGALAQEGMDQGTDGKPGEHEHIHRVVGNRARRNTRSMIGQPKNQQRFEDDDRCDGSRKVQAFANRIGKQYRRRQQEGDSYP
ncbi:MAG TPA: hypothetical protein VGK56_14630 [Anaerolineales bacterium]